MAAAALREGLKTVLVTSSHMMSKTQEARRQYANEFYLKRLFPSQRDICFIWERILRQGNPSRRKKKSVEEITGSNWIL